MPDADAPTAAVAVVLVGDAAVGEAVAARLGELAVVGTDAERLRGAGAVVGVAPEPWPGFAREHEEAGHAVAPAPYYAVQSWHRHPAYVERLVGALGAARTGAAPDAHVLFTAPGRNGGVAESTPEDVVFLRETAEVVSAAAGVARRSIAWTSGALGPSSLAALTALAEAHGRTSVVHCSLDPLARPDDVAGEGQRLGLHVTEARLRPDELPTMLAAVVATVVEHEQFGGGAA